MAESAKLTFKVQDKIDADKWRTPKWEEAEAENVACPKCGLQMTVIIGDTLYAHCGRCQKYFVGN